MKIDTKNAQYTLCSSKWDSIIITTRLFSPTSFICYLAFCSFNIITKHHKLYDGNNNLNILFAAYNFRPVLGNAWKFRQSPNCEPPLSAELHSFLYFFCPQDFCFSRHLMDRTKYPKTSFFKRRI
jgi:hypothetical protein